MEANQQRIIDALVNEMTRREMKEIGLELND